MPNCDASKKIDSRLCTNSPSPYSTHRRDQVGQQGLAEVPLGTVSQSRSLSRRVCMRNTTTPVVVIGAGLAGLTAAVHIARAGHHVVVHESRSRPGGLATTDVRDGFLCNQGPHALYVGGPADQILRTLGVTLRGGKPDPGGGRIVFDGSLELAPGGPSTLLRTHALTAREKANVGTLLAKLPRLNPSSVRHLTTTEWIDQSATGHNSRLLLHGLVRLSTYSALPDQLTAEVFLLQLQLALGKGVRYLDGGWTQIVSALTNRLAETGIGSIECGTPMTSLPDAPVVVVASGSAQRAGNLIGRSFDVGPAAHVSCLDLGMRGRPPFDFVLGADTPYYLSNHSAAAAGLAPDTGQLISVAQYLGTDEAPDRQGIDAFVKLAGIRETDIIMRRRLHQMTAVSSIPTVETGGLVGRPSVSSTGHDGVFIAGDWVGPTGHLADASIASGQAAAHAAIQYLAARKRAA
jgi:Flavin containing amine oxidoreductase